MPNFEKHMTDAVAVRSQTNPFHIGSVAQRTFRFAATGDVQANVSWKQVS